jgi:glycine/D-amino acid oxidase-like deaminating enzyme
MSYFNGEASHWLAASPTEPLTPSPLPAEKQDLVIVGGGLTGLWSAYCARQAHPDWEITIIEARHVGYGASGRNGGWLSTLLPGNRAKYAEAVDRALKSDPTGPVASAGLDGIASVRAFQSALFDSIDEVLEVCEAEGIDAHQVRGGHIDIAQSEAGMSRLRELFEGNAQFGYGPEDMQFLDAEETRAHINVDQAQGSIYFPGTAAVDPALLSRGLARVLRNQGVTICEDTSAGHIRKGVVATNRGPVRGETIFVCLEGYSDTVSGNLPGLEGRQVIPVFSSMIATEPLSAEAWEDIGWAGRECLGDTAHTFIYAQRTADDRIALGGRGAPYAYRSGLPGDGEVPAEVVEPAGRAPVLALPRPRFRHRPRVARGPRGDTGLVRRDLLRPRAADRSGPRLRRARGDCHASGREDPARPSFGGIDPADRAAVERSLLRAVGARADQVAGHPVDVPDLRHRRRLGAHHRGEADESARPGSGRAWPDCTSRERRTQ